MEKNETPESITNKYSKEEIEIIKELISIKQKTQFTNTYLSRLFKMSRTTLAQLAKYSTKPAPKSWQRLKLECDNINMILENASSIKYTDWDVHDEVVKRLMLKSKVGLTDEEKMFYYGNVKHRSKNTITLH